MYGFLIPHLEPTPGGYYARNSIKTKNLWPDHDGGGHAWIGVDAVELRPGGLIIRGACKWAPPTITNRLSAQYPDLTFDLYGCTEHERGERWTIKGGRARCIQMYLDDIREDIRTYEVKDGIDLETGEPTEERDDIP